MGDAVLFDPQGQTRLPIAGVGLSRALNKALDTETNPQWPEPRRPEEMESGISPRPGWTSQEQARRVAVAVPGSQAPVVTTSGVALRHPQLKLPSNNQSAMASGQSAQKILTEVSAGTNLMTARKGGVLYMFWNIDSDPRKNLRRDKDPRTSVTSAPRRRADSFPSRVSRASNGTYVAPRPTMRPLLHAAPVAKR